MSPLVLALGDPRAADPALVGPKAAHLSSLAVSHPVPPGFCLTAEAYRRAERAGGMDAPVREAVATAYAALVGDATPTPPVAVRSSALDEDGPAASFAGQHETILGVVGLDDVLDAIERTWASLRGEEARSYRRDHGLAVDGLALAVLVQHLVVADASGVAFSVAAAAAGNDLAGRPPAKSREPDVSAGNAGSRGLARGRARVLRDPSHAGALRPGEVLVATTTSQPWTPLFGIAAGLETDAGGVLSHTAVIAREYGLPAVVGTRVGTRRLRDGMLLEVDGDRGQVRIVREA